MTAWLDPLDLAPLEVGSNLGYIGWPLPCERDREVAEVVDRLGRESEPGERRVPLNREHGVTLCTFAERMASLAVRRHSPEDLRLGLLALALAASVSRDIRDEIVVMAPLWRSAEILGLDPVSEFTAAGEAVDGLGGQQLLSFAARSPRDRSLQAMGYIESSDEGGFRYKRTW